MMHTEGQGGGELPGEGQTVDVTKTFLPGPRAMPFHLPSISTAGAPLVLLFA